MNTKATNTSGQKPKDQYVNVGNINTRFWAAGDKGTAVILLHLGGGSVEDWVYNVNALARYHRVYAIDMVGAGRSDKPKLPSNWKDFSDYIAQFISDFMDTQHLERVTLVGNCIGGYHSLYFALRFPDKIDKLVLVASWGFGRDTPFLLRLFKLPIIPELIMRPSRKLTSRLWNTMIYDPALITDEMLETYYQLSTLPGAYKSLLAVLRTIEDFRGMRAETTRYLTDNLPAMTAPTFIVWGQQDIYRPIAHAYVAKERIPNSELHVFDPCGHLPQLEHPEEFNKLLLDFLAK
jgi:pimeloyl-ACP methyl ester carboxylesterase